MDDDELLDDFLNLAGELSGSQRPLRLRLGLSRNRFDDVLLAQRIHGVEALCDGIEMRVLCVAADACLPLKDFIALPAEIEIVTDRGELRSICGIVTEAAAGESDGGLATYQLVLRDALALMEKRTNSRIFRNRSELEIVAQLVDEWRQASPVMAAGFELEFAIGLTPGKYPRREMTVQHNESDAAFIRRLLRRRGICWHFRAGRAASSAAPDDPTPAHTLYLFDDASLLPENAAGTARFHRADATEERDTITAWSAVRRLQASRVTRFSWDYRNAHGLAFMRTQSESQRDQGDAGNALGASLDDYLIAMPHAGASYADHASLGRVRLARHDFDSKCFYAEGNVRDLCVGEYFTLDGHPEIDRHAPDAREFIVVEQQVAAQNNLPKSRHARIDRLFARSRWQSAGAQCLTAHDDLLADGEGLRYQTRLTCVRRGTPIAPQFDPRSDLPKARVQSALVVGPPGETVHCDGLGRVKIHFPGMRPADHEAANGAGASGSDADSAWVRVASGWAGGGPGDKLQSGALSLPRVGSEVLVDFLDGDPDKPVIVGQLFNNVGLPPALSETGGLPGNRYQSGIKSQEIRGVGSNQLRFDDTPGQISAQLASAHGASQLNLGWLSGPRREGRGDARGEGAELRSAQATTVRGGAGVLISAESEAGAPGLQLERRRLSGLAELLQGVAAQLAAFASVHAGDPEPGPQLAQLVEKLRHWDGDSNVAGAAGADPLAGAPIVAASGQAGMLLASQDNLMLGAQSRVDMVSLGDTDLSSGRHTGIHCGQGFTVFTQNEGIKLVAASGASVVLTPAGDIELATPARITLSAGTSISMQAPLLKLVAAGCQIDCGDGAIRSQCRGDWAVKSERALFSGPGDGSPEARQFPHTALETDERLIALDAQTGEPVKGRPYTITLPDGSQRSGVTDEFGRTELIQGQQIDSLPIVFERAP